MPRMLSLLSGKKEQTGASSAINPGDTLILGHLPLRRVSCYHFTPVRSRVTPRRFSLPSQRAVRRFLSGWRKCALICWDAETAEVDKRFRIISQAGGEGIQLANVAVN